MISRNSTFSKLTENKKFAKKVEHKKIKLNHNAAKLSIYPTICKSKV